MVLELNQMTRQKPPGRIVKLVKRLLEMMVYEQTT